VHSYSPFIYTYRCNNDIYIFICIYEYEGGEPYPSPPMRVAKRVNKETRAPISSGALQPLDAEDYPEYLVHEGHEYFRIWVRPRVIVYEVLTKKKEFVGWWVVPFDKMVTSWTFMESMVELNEKNLKLKIIAR
jgi:hypothetical protein